jgi:hypothetical protein
VTRDDRERPRLDWPPAVGEAFAASVTETFAQDRPPLGDEEALQLWDASAEWRAITLQHGRRLTEDMGGTGIRRAEMVNALGHHLGVLDRRDAFAKPGDLIARLPADRQPVAMFLIDVLNVCHQRNQAAVLSRPEGCTVLHNVPSVLARAASAVVGDGLRAARSSPESLTLAMRVPTVESLLRADTGEVVAARTGDAGTRFRAAHDAWLQRGGSERADELREAARLYGEALAAAAKGPRMRAGLHLDRRLAKVALPAAANTGVSLSLQGLTAVAAPTYTLLAAATGLALSAFFAFYPESRVPRTAYVLPLARQPDVEQNLWATPKGV